MFLKEGVWVLVALQSGKRTGGAGNPLSITEGDWEGLLCPIYRIDILLNLILFFPGTLNVPHFVRQ
jgi:hypothetical protein